MYKKVDTNLNFVQREKEVEKFWDDNNIFEKSIDSRKKGESYVFYDGPPTANGKPHIGHVLTRAIKDMIPRYRAMKGYQVPRKAGWDTHGLPVELEVEKMLGLDGKEQIEEYGLEPFIKKCKESVWKYKGMWEDFSGTVGFWADMEHPYVTYDNNFIESEWWALKQIYEKGLLYKGFKIVPYCPRCGTPLSSHEVAQGYRTVKERSAIVRFKLVGKDEYFLAWTTTPWTLPSNVALCVNPDETYCKVEAADGYTYILAEALLDTVLGKLATEDKPAYKVLETYKGKDLEYIEYEPLYECAGESAKKQGKKGHFVTCDSYVTMSDGTGIVHIAPAFGEDDSKVGKKYDLPFVQFVDGKGDMTAETPYAGIFVKDADPEVLKDLDKSGKLFAAPKFEHDYPHCWRCGSPLIYYARDTWFIKMTDVKDRLIANNNTINWIPESIGKGRFGDWLKNVQDWGISRNRYWGTPLNIWECECGYVMKCPHCDVSMTLHRNGKLVCHYCGYETHNVSLCPECGSKYILGFKAGTEAVEDAVKKMFPAARVLRMDMDTTKGKGGHENILSAFATEQADILIGTQMIVKGHDFPKVTLVGVVAADISLYASDYKAVERTFQLITQAAGRAGRGERKGEVVIQTYSPDNYGLLCAAEQNYKSFYEQEMSYRKLLSYPPVNNMVKINISSINEKLLSERAGNIKALIQQYIQDNNTVKDDKIIVLGPSNASIYKIKDIYTKQIYLRSSSFKALELIMDMLDNNINGSSDYKNINIAYDVN